MDSKQWHTLALGAVVEAGAEADPGDQAKGRAFSNFQLSLFQHTTGTSWAGLKFHLLSLFHFVLPNLHFNIDFLLKTFLSLFLLFFSFFVLFYIESHLLTF